MICRTDLEGQLIGVAVRSSTTILQAIELGWTASHSEIYTDNALNPGKEDLFIFGVRGRIHF